MTKSVKRALLVAFVTMLFGFIGFNIDNLLDINGAVFSSILAIAATAASVVYYVNKTKDEDVEKEQK